MQPVVSTGESSDPMRDQPSVDKRRIASCFSSAALSYDQAANLQRQIGHALLDYMQAHISWGTIPNCLDIGCGTGFMLKQLHAQGIPVEHLVGMDVSAAMLHQARMHLPSLYTVQADAEHLPFPSNHFALVVSNLAVQWLPGLDDFLCEALRVLKPGGYLAFTTLGTDTLKELAWLRALCELPASVNPGIEQASLVQVLNRSSLRPVCCMRRAHTHRYPDALSLMRDLKLLGAHHVNGTRVHNLQGKHQLRQLNALSQHHYPDGMPARYDTYFVILQKPLVEKPPH